MHYIEFKSGKKTVMCIVSFRWAPSHTFPLVIIANRDEFYPRPSLPSHSWKENPKIFAGKDLKAGGSWLGLNTNSGRIAILTNYWDNITGDYKYSRGKVVTDLLASENSIANDLENLRGSAQHYAGFNLLTGDAHSLYYFSNKNPSINRLSPGIHGFSNGSWNDQWVKVNWLNKSLQTCLTRYKSDLTCNNCIDSLFNALHYETKNSKALRPDISENDAIELFKLTCFIKSDIYGTRNSTIILQDNTGNIHWHEKLYGVRGSNLERFNHRLSIKKACSKAGL